MRGEEWIRDELAAIEAAGLKRRLTVHPATGGKMSIGGRVFLNFSSNDYLDLARHPAVVAAAERALREAGCGATASRLGVGTLSWHEELERRLARFKGCASALAFGSGYLANAGVIPALVGRDDAVLADRLAHASIVDAVVLSRAKLLRFEHNDAGHLEELLRKREGTGRCLIVTESVFSMDGDLAPLADFARLAAEHGAMLMVDEAHATGVFGPGGSGLIRRLGLEAQVNVSMGTLSKALGSYGGFVAGSAELRDLLVNRARSFIYSTGLPPASAGAALGALTVLEENPGMGARLLERAALLRRLLMERGFDTGRSDSQIVPVIVGENQKAVSLAHRLREAGILIVAIRPPTVPRGTARIRLSVTLAHEPEDLRNAVERIAEAARAEGLR